MHPTSEQPGLGTLLADLPRAHASAAFTTLVFDRLARRRRRAARWRRTLTAVATTLVLAAGWWGIHAHRRHRDTQQELAAIRRELHTVRQELHRLERLETASRPLLYLGSTDEVDLVVDLNRWARQQRRYGDATTRPAALIEPRRR